MIEQLLQVRSLIEIAVLAALFLVILSSVRGTRGEGILKGIIFLFVVAFLVAMYLVDVAGLNHLQDMLRWALSGSALALIVIFAPEIRRVLTRLGKSPLLSPLLRGQSIHEVKELADAAVRLSKNRIGALIVLERDDGLKEYIENGVRIDAALTSELLETIFFPGNALHDGAVVVQHDRVAAAACLLPLSDDPTLSKSMGTRHRAAIGISVETDAITVVVSEETGRISVTADGKLTTDLTRDALEKQLTDLLARRALGFRKPPPEPGAAPAPKPAPETGNGPVAGGEKPPEEKKP
jgi:diadenylate cyclase